MSENTPPQYPLSTRFGLLHHLPEEIVAGVGEREVAQQDFVDNPHDSAVWNNVIHRAIAEEQSGTQQPDALSQIKVSDLYFLAETVLATKPEARYDLMAQKAPNGHRWFDVLYGFHSKTGDEALNRSLKISQNTIEVAVDLGTGTGKTAAVVSQYATRTIGLDRNANLLAAARADNPAIEFIQGSVTELPFADESIDLLTSDGLKHALDADTARAMYTEIARVLKDGGEYLDTDWTPAGNIALSVGAAGDVERPDYHPEELDAIVTWKALLQDMIVDTVSGKFEIHDRMPEMGHDWSEFLTQLGLVEKKGTSRYASSVRALVKDPELAIFETAMHRRHLRGFIES